MIEENVIQRQGRIKRQMLEQQLAVPFNINSESLLTRMSEKMLRDIDSKMLETNPLIKINLDGDKIRINPIPPEKVYVQSGMYNKPVEVEDVWNWPKLNDAVTKADEYIEREDSRIELTLTNGVFE